VYLKGSEGTKNLISPDVGLGIEGEIKYKKIYIIRYFSLDIK
jgi:hypothetical protein